MDDFKLNISVSQFLDELNNPTPAQRKKLISLLAFHCITKIHRSFNQRSRSRYDAFNSPRWKPLSKARKKYKAKKRPGTEKLINIFTRKLVTSLKPGRVRGNTYYPNSKFQSVQINPDSFSFATTVKYAKHVDKVRPILPADMDRLINQSLKLAYRDYLKDLK